MAYIRVSKEFSFEMAHSLAGYDGLCSEIHGHSYRLFVTVAGTACADSNSPKYGMVMDFGDLKRIVTEQVVGTYDHALLIRAGEGDYDMIELIRRKFSRLQVVDFQPTCENLVSLFAGLIRDRLPGNVTLHSVKLHETATSFAEWFASDNS